MLTSVLWSESQTAALRPKVLKAADNGESVQCPEDGATLHLEADHAIFNLVRAVWAKCPKCDRTDRFA
jgi:hypothetical protein